MPVISNSLTLISVSWLYLDAAALAKAGWRLAAAASLTKAAKYHQKTIRRKHLQLISAAKSSCGSAARGSLQRRRSEERRLAKAGIIGGAVSCQKKKISYEREGHSTENEEWKAKGKYIGCARGMALAAQTENAASLMKRRMRKRKRSC